jgi:hypothetical protein
MLPSMRRAKSVAIVGAALLTGLATSRAARAEDHDYPLTVRFPPHTLPYDDGGPIPPGYHLEERPTKSYVILGTTIFGAAYLPSLFVTAAVVGGRQPDAPRIEPLAIPIAGPFITILTAHTGVPGGVVLVADGIAQTGGVLLLISGLKIREPVLVFNTINATARLSVTPGSVSLHGTF